MGTRRCIFDLEANGLLHEATQIWCGTFIDLDTNEVFEFRPHQLEEMKSFMDSCKVLMAHNGIMYDFPLMEKVIRYNYQGERVDTWLMSQLLFPERFQHGVDAWGKELGRLKPKHEDWSKFSEEMMHRCTEDTHIQVLIYKKCLERMAYLKEKGVPFPKKAFDLTFNYFEILSRQEQSGWKFDVERARRYVRQLGKWSDMIDDVLKPRLPMVYSVYGNPVQKPFKKDGNYSSITLRWYEDAEETKIVGGQFSRIEWRLLDLGKPEVKDFLLDEGWQPKEWNFNKEGKQSSPKLNGSDPFEGINGKVGKLIAKRIQIHQRRNIIKGWLTKVRANGRLSQEINGLADTRRLKHSVLVNVPSPEAFYGTQMRKLFISEEGYKLVGTDATGCQDRMLLARGKKYGYDDPKFEHMLLHGSSADGTDSHSQARDAINKALRKNKLPEIIRKTAKNFNFAYKFACGDGKLGDMAKASNDKKYKVGKDVRAEMNKLFSVQFQTSEYLKEFWKPTAKRVHNKERGELVWEGGFIPSLDNAPVRVRIEKDCLVYALQSDEAIMMQYAVMFFDKWCIKQEGWVYGRDFRYCGCAHDEWTVEVKEELSERCRELAEKAINHASKHLGLAVEQLGDGQIGDNWYDIH